METSTMTQFEPLLYFHFILRPHRWQYAVHFVSLLNLHTNT